MNRAPPRLKAVQKLLLPVQPEMVHVVNNVHMDCGVRLRLCPRCHRGHAFAHNNRFRRIEASVGFEPRLQRFGTGELVLCSRDEISFDSGPLGRA